MKCFRTSSNSTVTCKVKVHSEICSLQTFQFHQHILKNRQYLYLTDLCKRQCGLSFILKVYLWVLNPWFICLGTKATTQATTVANTSAVLLQPSPILRICLKAVYGAVISLLLTSYHPWLSTPICSTPWSAQVVCIMLLALLSSAQGKNKQSRVEPRQDARGNNASRSIVSLQQVFP